MIGVWLGEERRTNAIKRHVQKILDYVLSFINYSMLDNEHFVGRHAYSNKESTNMHLN